MQKLNHSSKKQKGAVLILLAFIIGLGVLAFTLHAFDPARIRAEQDKKTYQTLNAAKKALIAWSVSHPNTPGLMPYPDRNNDSNYDDTSDCYAVNVSFNTIFTLGRLPLFKSDPNCINAKTNVNSGVSGDFRDATGERLWYEVSQNLLHDYNNAGGTIPNGTSPIINPSIANAPANPWFVVRDRSGAVISDRVAAVIIAPGAPNGTQDRSGGIANANQYLDKIVMADNTPYKNYDYQLPAIPPEFIIGDDYRTVAKNDLTYKNQTVEPYYFNDKLVYITIDELMAAVEYRAMMEARNALNKYRVSEGTFPHSAMLGATTNFSCDGSSLKGFLPVESKPPTTCSCTWGATRACTCPFSNSNSITFTMTSGSYSTAQDFGACSRTAARVCTCTGAGRCRNTSGTRTFTCNAAGDCTSNSIGTYRFSGTFNTISAGCTVPVCNGVGAVTCSAAGTFGFNACSDQPFNSVTTNSLLPAWFTTNKWQDYIYYDSTNPLTIGTKPGIQAVLISAGAPIIVPFAAASKSPAANQERPSCDIKNYLDSAINTDSNTAFDSITTQRTSNYNDQAVIVAP